jgi:hypothetical protein
LKPAKKGKDMAGDRFLYQHDHELLGRKKGRKMQELILKIWLVIKSQIPRLPSQLKSLSPA